MHPSKKLSSTLHKILDNDDPVTEIMPLDLTVLLNTPGFLSFDHRHNGIYAQLYNNNSTDQNDNIMDGDEFLNSTIDSNNNSSAGDPPFFGVTTSTSSSVVVSEQPFVCRRAASFPTFCRPSAKHTVAAKSSDLARRCFSETNIKQDSRAILIGLTLEDLKRQLAALLLDEVNDKMNDESNKYHRSLNNNNENGSGEPIDPNNRYAADLAAASITAKKMQKKVSFADDMGRLLASVRVMGEPSDVPPILTSPAALALIAAHDPESQSITSNRLFFSNSSSTPYNNNNNNGLTTNTTNEAKAGDQRQNNCLIGQHHGASNWKLEFVQPASDYIKFRHKLDQNNVALENILLKNNDVPVSGPVDLDVRMVGTVKVKNIAFEKTVLLRYTWDGWATFKDEPCAYVPQLHQNKRNTSIVPDIIDTFQFDVTIPKDDEQHTAIELCICFRAGVDQKEYWDSNDGKNFRINSKLFGRGVCLMNSPAGKRVQSDSLLSRIDSEDDDECENLRMDASSPMTSADGRNIIRPPPGKRHLRRRSSNDAFELQFDNWTEFSTAKHLDTQGPYW